MEDNTTELINCVTAELAAMERVHQLETDAGLVTPMAYQRYVKMREYCRLKIEVYSGRLPASVLKKFEPKAVRPRTLR